MKTERITGVQCSGDVCYFADVDRAMTFRDAADAAVTSVDYEEACNRHANDVGVWCRPDAVEAFGEEEVNAAEILVAF